MASLDRITIEVSDELQVAEAKICVLLSLNVPMAVNGWPEPKGVEGLVGVTAIETKLGGAKVPGWYSSALARTFPLLSSPPAKRTAPPSSSVAAGPLRAVLRLPALVKVSHGGVVQLKARQYVEVDVPASGEQHVAVVQWGCCL